MAITATRRNMGIANGLVTRGNGSIATNSTAQTLFEVNTERQFLLVQNPSTNTEALFVDFTSNATLTSSVELATGTAIVFSGTFVPSDKITVNAASAGHTFVAYQG